jgi:hypothetical protein
MCKLKINTALNLYGYLPLLLIIQQYQNDENYEACSILRRCILERYKKYTEYGIDIFCEIYNNLLTKSLEENIIKAKEYYQEELPYAFQNIDIYTKSAKQLIET